MILNLKKKKKKAEQGGYNLLPTCEEKLELVAFSLLVIHMGKKS